jgi:F-type H+-transporting ATPase subunit delta
MFRLTAKRFLATQAATQMKVTFAVPHLAIVNKVVDQVNLSTTDGDMGILVGHVPTVLQLKPSVLTLISKEGNQKYFVSGGFAVMNPDSTLNINAIEAFELKDLDVAAARQKLEEAKRVVSGTDEEKAIAAIQIEVLEAVVASSKA